MRRTKKRLAGFIERRDHLRQVFPKAAIPESRPEAKGHVVASNHLGKDAGANDVLDAIVAAWSAARKSTGESKRIPSDVERDETGLTMAIAY